MNRILYSITVLASLAGFIMLLGLWLIIYPYPYLSSVYYLTLFAAGFIAAVSGFVLLITKSGISKFNRIFIVTCCVFGIFLMAHLIVNKMIRPSYAVYPPCSTNLSHIGRALAIYSQRHGRYPDPDKWCDILLDEHLVNLQDLVEPSLVIRLPFSGRIIHCWPRPARGRCDYALNPDATPKSAIETVLAFEAVRGWNQHDFHNLRNCHGFDKTIFLYNDSHVEAKKFRDILNN